MYKYVLIGIPNCGKSTLGKRAADRLKMPFFDTDEMVRANMGEMRLMDTFSSYYNRRFREEQIKAVTELANINDSAIIATGAEVALIPECVSAMQRVSVFIHLKREIKTILDELKESAKSRNVWVNVNDGSILDFREKAVTAFSDDIPKYDILADFTVDNNGSEDEGADKLVSLIQSIVEVLSKKQDTD